MSNYERTGWRDEAISRRHRDWGLKTPMVDIDFLVVEYASTTPRALVEYKHEKAKHANFTDSNYTALTRLANKSGIPLFSVRYKADISAFRVWTVNDVGRNYRDCAMSEKEWVGFLYWLRGEEVPSDIAKIIAG